MYLRSLQTPTSANRSSKPKNVDRGNLKLFILSIFRESEFYQIISNRKYYHVEKRRSRPFQKNFQKFLNLCIPVAYKPLLLQTAHHPKPTNSSSDTYSTKFAFPCFQLPDAWWRFAKESSYSANIVHSKVVADIACGAEIVISGTPLEDRKSDVEEPPETPLITDDTAEENGITCWEVCKENGRKKS